VTYRTLIFATAALIVGCGDGTPPPSGPMPDANLLGSATAESLIPLKAGNRWDYEVESFSNLGGRIVRDNEEVAFVVRDVQTSGDRRRAKVDVVRNGRTVDRMEWQVDGKGFSYLARGMGGEDYSSPQLVAPLPLEPSGTFKWSGTGPCPDGEPGKMELEGQVVGVQFANTAQGETSAIAVEHRIDFQSSKIKGQSGITTWYRPDTGIVRMRQSTVGPRGSVQLTLKLKKASL